MPLNVVSRFYHVCPDRARNVSKMLHACVGEMIEGSQTAEPARTLWPQTVSLDWFSINCEPMSVLAPGGASSFFLFVLWLSLTFWLKKGDAVLRRKALALGSDMSDLLSQAALARLFASLTGRTWHPLSRPCVRGPSCVMEVSRALARFMVTQKKSWSTFTSGTTQVATVAIPCPSTGTNSLALHANLGQGSPEGVDLVCRVCSSKGHEKLPQRSHLSF